MYESWLVVFDTTNSQPQTTNPSRSCMEHGRIRDGGSEDSEETSSSIHRVWRCVYPSKFSAMQTESRKMHSAAPLCLNFREANSKHSGNVGVSCFQHQESHLKILRLSYEGISFLFRKQTAQWPLTDCQCCFATQTQGDKETKLRTAPYKSILMQIGRTRQNESESFFRPQDTEAKSLARSESTT